MGWDSKTPSGVMSETIISSGYAPGGIQSTMGGFGETSTIDAFKNALSSFLTAGGSAAAQTLMQDPGIKAQVTAYGVQAIKTVEKSQMQAAFEKFYNFYDQNRTLVYAGGGLAIIGTGFLIFKRRKKRK